MHHIVKKQVFDLTLPAEQNAFELQHRISSYNQQEIISVLQKVFDEISADDENLYIDKLIIDLGNISLKKINSNNWADIIEMELRKQLKNISATPENKKNFLRLPKTTSIFRQWMFSMQNGYLPWNSSVVNDTWYTQVLEAIATEHKIADELRLELGNNKTVVQRIVLQHAVTFLISLVELLTAEKQDKLADVAGEFFSAAEFLHKKTKKNVTVSKRFIETSVWINILHQISAVANIAVSANESNAYKIIIRLIKFFFSKQQVEIILRSKPISAKLPVTLTAFKKALEEKNHDPDSQQESSGNNFFVPTDGKSFQEKVLLKKVQTKKDARASEHISKTGVIQPTNTDSERIEKKPADKKVIDKEDIVTKKSLQKKQQSENVEIRPAIPQKNTLHGLESEDKIKIPVTGGNQRQNDFITAIGNDEIYIKNAGVILLHPFLNSFFKILGYVNEGAFVSDYMRLKALYLIHFMATGETEAQEYDLTIAKIICAYPLEEPVDKVVELNEKELQEADNMITAAIANWQILKNTSVAGLREGFLQRPGKLFVKNGELQLHVEASSIDMLLDHLPWNLSIIKLSWMKHALHVQWR